MSIDNPRPLSNSGEATSATQTSAMAVMAMMSRVVRPIVTAGGLAMG